MNKLIKYNNLTNKKFNRLLAIKVVGRAKNRTILWECLCDCGNIVVVRANHLKHNHTQSCGCLHKEKLTGLYVKDLIGKRFNRLIVTGRSSKKVQRAAVWKCLCDCGKVTNVHTAALLSGHTNSCGCFHFDRIWRGGKSYDPYCQDWTKEYKEFIKNRDGNKCLNPCCWKKDKILSVHHIDYNKKNCKSINLITVCRSCNSRANTDRDWHTSWYNTIMYRRYK